MAELHVRHGGAHADHPHAHHEERDVNIRGIFGFAIGLIVAAVLIHFMVWVLFKYFSAREARQAPPEFPLAVQQQNRLPPEPRLQTNPRQDLDDLRAREESTLRTYGWIDKNAGVVRIPIDRAMELTVQRGLPSRQQANDHH